MVADRILGELRAPLPVGEHRLVLNASVGITMSAGQPDRGPTELLRDADTAMYAAKQAGKGRYQSSKPRCSARSSLGPSSCAVWA